jgi:DNA-binding SARP family transcriptional activator
MPRLVTLGGLALLGDERPVAGSVGRGRNVALLALLARPERPGPTREKLSALLWPESDPERARHSLDQALYTVRRALGPEAFVAGATWLSLNPEVVSTDVAEFVRSLESDDPVRAVELYAGPFLEGFHLPGALEFERWSEGERDALHRRYVRALEALATEAEARGDPARAVAWCRRLASAEPLSSRVVLRLMRALDDAGERAGALQAARVHAALVLDELGAEADPSVLEYEKELRSAPQAAASRLDGEPAFERPHRRHGSSGAATPRPAATPGPAATPAAVLAPGGGRASARASEPPPVHARGRLAIAALLAVILVATSMALLADGDATAPAGVAVVPFTNETGDPAFDAVGQMAADWIIEGLVRTGLTPVVERAPGDEAGGPPVRGVVSGRIYRTADSLWLQARVVRPGDGVVLRALDPVGTTASHPEHGVDALRQEVLGALGTLFDPRLADWSESALRPPSFPAYQEFVAGLELHGMPRDLQGAARRFRRAAELDPDYVAPRLWFAWASILMEDYARADSAVAALRAEREHMSPLERAWHDRIAALLAGDNEASYRAARRMVDIAPRSGWVIALANAALDTNRPEVAISALRGAGMDHLGLEAEHGWFLLTAAHHRLGEHVAELAATEQARRAVGLGWGHSGAGVPPLAALGRIEDLERRLVELRHGPGLDGGGSAGLRSLLTAVEELRAHGFADEADSLLARSAEAWLLDPGGEAQGTFPAGEGGVVERGARFALLYESGHWQAAERLLAGTARGDRDHFRDRAMAALLAARSGNADTARRIADDLAAVDGPYLFGEVTLWRARIESVLGNHAAAVPLMRQAFAEGQGAYAWHLLHVGRDFDALRELPDFRELMRPQR